MIPANDMLLFVDVVKLKSFSEAANKHHITPAAVSKRITQLEAKLQVKLLNRSTRKLSLTETGELLYQHCAQLSLDLEETLATIVDTHKKPQGHLNIHAPTNFSNLVLAPILPDFFELYPNIKINIVIDDSTTLPELDEYDIAIKNCTLVDSNAIMRKILKVRMMTCVSKAYAKKYGIPNTPKDLLKHNCLDYGYHNQFDLWNFNHAGKSFNVAVQGNFTANSALLVKHLCIAGLGVAWLPNFMITKELRDGSLVPCLDTYESDAVDVYALHPYANKHVPTKVRVFLDFLQQKLPQDL